MDIQKKAEYKKYPMNFSILSDFNDDDLDKMMDLEIKYSGEGSYVEFVLELNNIPLPIRIQPLGQVPWFLQQKLP